MRRQSTKSARATRKEAARNHQELAASVEATPVETSVETAPVEQPAAVELAPTAKAKAAKPAKATKVKKDVSMSATLRQFICEDPRITVDALLAKLEEAGFPNVSKVTAATLRNDARATLSAAKSAGILYLDVDL
jgi:hypothetical protein